MCRQVRRRRRRQLPSRGDTAAASPVGAALPPQPCSADSPAAPCPRGHPPDLKAWSDTAKRSSVAAFFMSYLQTVMRSLEGNVEEIQPTVLKYLLDSEHATRKTLTKLMCERILTLVGNMDRPKHLELFFLSE
ncbi:Protein of unknown function [Gryllus bimaculatus]|nr:Protein of unknown function [Gryllus bimaculatus]